MFIPSEATNMWQHDCRDGKTNQKYGPYSIAGNSSGNRLLADQNLDRLTDWMARSLTHSLTQSFAHALIHSVTLTNSHTLTCSVSESVTH